MKDPKLFVILLVLLGVLGLVFFMISRKTAA